MLIDLAHSNFRNQNQDIVKNKSLLMRITEYMNQSLLNNLYRIQSKFYLVTT
ncbi:hypothetical protein HYE39_02920 [Mycoplasmopsis bovis]|nr:hypothetical protein [Mycoplasmopsis bovis]QQH21141.1 hypothetical protein HYE39_02920 [Mycoplasmopsis bovis]